MSTFNGAFAASGLFPASVRQPRRPVGPPGHMLSAARKLNLITSSPPTTTRTDPPATALVASIVVDCCQNAPRRRHVTLGPTWQRSGSSAIMASVRRSYTINGPCTGASRCSSSSGGSDAMDNLLGSGANEGCGHSRGGGVGGGNGANGPGHGSSSSSDDDGNGRDPGASASPMFIGGSVAVAAAVTACLALPAPAAAAAATPSSISSSPPSPTATAPSHQPSPPAASLSVAGGSGDGTSSWAAVDATAAAAASDSDEHSPLSSSSQPQLRLKRLLREAFAELTELRLRVETLEAAEAEAAGEALVVPLEGFAVRPAARALAPGTRLRCSAQVSGQVDTPFLAPVAAAATTSAAAAAADGEEHRRSSDGGGSLSPPYSSDGDDPSWNGLMAAAGLIAKPRLRLAIQSLWGDQHGNGAAGGGGSGSTGGAAAAAAAAATFAPLSRRRGGEQQQQEDRPVMAAHLQLVTEPGGHNLQIDKLLLKAEAHPRLRLLLATHGSLENIGKNVNPFAAGTGVQRGMTAAMRRGHDLTVLSQASGSGAALAAAAGDISLAVGAFSAPSSSTGVASATTTCAQLSLHRSRRLALSALWTSCAAIAATAAANGDRAIDGTGLMQRGVVAVIQPADRLTAAIWMGEATVSNPAATITCCSAAAPLSTGADTANDGGASLTRPLDHPPALSPVESDQAELLWGPRRRERRVGLRLATLPDLDTGRSYAMCVSHRRETGKEANGAGGGGGEPSSYMWVAELSAGLPLAHGAMLTPGLVLLRKSGDGRGRSLLLMGAQTSWSF